MANTDGASKRPLWQEHLRADSQSSLTQADDCRHSLSATAIASWRYNEPSDVKTIANATAYEVLITTPKTSLAT